MNTFMHRPLWAVVIFCLAVLPATAADLMVDIKDQATLRTLESARVIVTDRDGRRTEATSNTQGRVRFEGLAPGLYELLITQANYNSVRLPSVRVIEDKTTPVNVALVAVPSGMEEVLILGSGNTGRWLSSAGATELDREALRSSAGSGGDVLRALDGLPGLFSDGEYSSFTVRGNGPRDNQILVDGVPFDNVVHFSDNFGELEDVEGGGRYSVFAPNTIGKADFQPGGWSAAYGGRAGSLLQLEVAEGNPETPSYSARIDIAGLEVGYDGPTGVLDNTSLLFSARQLNFGRLFEMVGLDDVGEPELTDIILKTTTRFDSGGTFNFLAIHAPEEYNRDIDHVLASDEDEPGTYEDVDLVSQTADNTLVSLRWQHLLGESADLTNSLYYRHYGEESQSGEAYPDLVPLDTPASEVPQRFPIITSQRDESEIGWRLDFGYDNVFGRFSAGVRVLQLDLDLSLALDDDWIRYEYDQSDFRPSSEQKYIVLTPESLNSAYADKSVQYAGYLEQSFALGPLDLRAGLRFDADELTGHDAVSPRLGTSWPVGESVTLTATAGRYLQAPRIDELAIDSANTNLDYEKIDQLTVGMSYRYSDNIEIFIEPYYQVISDRIVQLDGVNQTYGNIGEGTSFGVDTAITRYFANGWSASATYSYNDAVYKDSAQGEEYDADYNRPHAFGLGGVWEINQRWKVSSRVKWASGRPFGDFIVNDNVLGDGEPLRYSKETISNNTERYDSYSSVNIRVDYRRDLGPMDVIAFVDIINVLGAENPNNSEFNERTGEDTPEEGSMLPLLGLRFEW
ncbi:TonB-dependent receptor [Gilvimarinus japonicus]|uniref:TonB-dependent receptor domain-containing protein n=2 Tax=Gilvimarinus japonicus TaxID=1796469 RepID=A0ABV7HPY6_9GAMM